MVELIDLHKSFGEQKVLAGVNLKIPRGRLTFIMGRSGTGKSVLLKHMIGLLRPDRGKILIDGEDVTDYSPAQWQRLRRRFGFLFQEGALFDSMTVAENVAFPLMEHTRLSRREIEKRVEEKLAVVGLLEARDKYPAELSGGMRKRAALARALALEPEIILFDEPTTGLDPILQVSIMKLIRETQRRFGLTGVVVSHDVPIALQAADFIAMLHEGRVVAFGPPKEIRESDHPFVRQFLRSAFEGCLPGEGSHVQEKHGD
ncbi:ABC transporter ATP-binding protein [Thermosulfurimonas marina]|uniref:ABC transporter ATP-binding protein n=1 Tax=Thermosulfurimonas marina TaxID=2047767 RepID=A0A6H1WTW8_9BACT|nr:ABC transporter ATP-binding protein [Thermosulfurimonas marina]QJA06653.1 ABC transporter ATP-binding protein [Thermosulfurimonas marina]